MGLRPGRSGKLDGVGAMAAAVDAASTIGGLVAADDLTSGAALGAGLF